MANTHHLKTMQPYFDAVWRGDKTFEVRRNDRDFQTGDSLVLEELPSGESGVAISFSPPRIIEARISYTLHGGQFGIQPGYCVLGLAEVKHG